MITGDNRQQSGSEFLETLILENQLEQSARRYTDLVYAAALRQMNGNTDAAADITQAVMLVMLQKVQSGNLPQERFMAGWLLKVTRYAVMQTRRAVARRARHEANAAKFSQPANDPQTLDADVRAALDSAILSLGQLDRELVVRRYLQDQTVAEVAAVVSMNPNTTGRRIARVMDKLHRILARRGITAPVAILTTVLSAEVAVKAPAAGASTAIAQQFAADIAMKVIRRLAIGKLAMAVMIVCGLLVITAGVVAIVLPDINPSKPLPPVPKPTPQPRSLSVDVASIVAGPSDALLHQVLAGLLENQRKLQTIHVASTTIYCSYDQQNRHWLAPLSSWGEAWTQSGPQRKTRVEIARGQRLIVQEGKPLPVRTESYVECWNGSTTFRKYGPPLSSASGETFNKRYLYEESLLGRDWSMQLPWDEESSADMQGSHKTIDRYSLDPAVLAKMNLSAREVLLAGGRDAMELDIKTPNEVQMQHNETFWFNATRGYGLLARLDTISLNGSIVVRTVYLIDDITQAGPGIFYPTAGEKFLEMRGQPIYWERFDATSVVANEPLSDASFRVDFPSGMPVRDFIDNIGTKRDWNTYQPQP